MPKPWDQVACSEVLTHNNCKPVVIVGAGLAGCWLARTLAQRGVRVTVLEAGVGVANAGSSNPVGLFKPTVTRADSQGMQFHLAAYQCLLNNLKQWELEAACQLNRCGVVQLVEKSYPSSEHYERITREQMPHAIGQRIDANALLFKQAGWLNPAALCSALLEHKLIDVRCEHKVNNLVVDEQNHWRILCDTKPELITEHLVLATGIDSAALPFANALDTIAARGQLSRFSLAENAAQLKTVVNGRSYIIPDGNSVVVGATFERHVRSAAITNADNATNLSGLKDTLPQMAIKPCAIEAFAGVRATTHDRLPMVGPVPDVDRCLSVYGDIRHGRSLNDYPSLPVHKGLYAVAGLGSRGIVTAPYAAQLLCNYMFGGQEIDQWMPLINPARFLIRQLKSA